MLAVPPASDADGHGGCRSHGWAVPNSRTGTNPADAVAGNRPSRTCRRQANTKLG